MGRGERRVEERQIEERQEWRRKTGEGEVLDNLPGILRSEKYELGGWLISGKLDYHLH